MMTITTSRPRRSTIEDVAAAAGVSVATVSRALRGLPNVAISTRDKVTDVAQRLGYSPDPAASRLAAGRTQTITIVVPNLSGWYFSTVVAGAEALFATSGYDVLVVGVGSRNDLSRLLSEGYHLERRTDGLVVVDVPIAPAEAESITERGVAITTVGNATVGHSSIRIDNHEVGQLVADHLLDLGHRRIGVIGGMRDDPMNFEVPKLRHRGFVHALQRRSIPFDGDLVEGGNFGIDGGQEAMSLLLERDEPPTAVFAMSDEMAFGALMELRRRGLLAGADVSVVGVDDHEFSRVVGLTTVRQPVVDHGAAAARLLLDAMAVRLAAVAPFAASGHADIATVVTPREVLAPVELVVRETTGPPAWRHA